MKIRVLLVALAAALALSVVVIAYVLREARRAYGEMLSVRLDPSSSSSFAAANAELAPKAKGEIRIVLLGDSRVEHWIDPPSLPGVRVLNRGMGGDTTAQALSRVDRDVLAIGADVCVIQCGVNDLKAIGVFADQAQEIQAGCVERLREIVSRLTGSGVRVVLLTVLPSADVPFVRRPFWSDAVDQAIVTVNAELRSISGPLVRVIDCDHEFRDGTRLVKSLADDQLHLNRAGYDTLSGLLRPVIVEEVGRVGR